MKESSCNDDLVNITVSLPLGLIPFLVGLQVELPAPSLEHQYMLKTPGRKVINQTKYINTTYYHLAKNSHERCGGGTWELQKGSGDNILSQGSTLLCSNLMESSDWATKKWFPLELSEEATKEIISSTFANIKPICARLALVIASNNLPEIKKLLSDLKVAVLIFSDTGSFGN